MYSTVCCVGVFNDCILWSAGTHNVVEDCSPPSLPSHLSPSSVPFRRRAQLRDCLEVLRQHVPLPDKLTTLALLQSAKKYIEVCVSE